MQREYDMIDDGSKLGPIEVYNVLERIMYNRRYVLRWVFKLLLARCRS